MNTDELITGKIEHVWETYIFAQEVYFYTEYFHNPRTKEELEIIISDFPGRDIRFIMHIMFRTLIIETCKLFRQSRVEKFSLYALLNSLSGTEAGDLIAREFKEEMRQNKGVIDIIFLLRDKCYAHYDLKITELSKIEITIQKIKQLLDLAYKIIHHVGSNILNTVYINDPVRFDRNRFILLHLMAKAEKQRRENIVNEAINLMNRKK